MSQPSDKVNPFDPMSFWRTSQDATLEAWSKAMIDLVNSEAYSEATARLLDTYLSVSAPARKLLSQTMAQVLTQLNMPTEAEVTGLAERLTNIEMRLDDLDARLDTILHTLDTIASAGRPAEGAAAATANAPRSRSRGGDAGAAATSRGRRSASGSPSPRGVGARQVSPAGGEDTPRRRARGASDTSATAN
ncbi:MAG TPA: hypothetical protein VJQ45_12035, partial [Ktedonobacterales bacterium]|nr:hypothetical protein [Ktedonobacterales bacterium]